MADGMHKLVTSGTGFGKWYVIDGDLKRWVLSLDALTQQGLNPSSLETVPDDLINSLYNGAMVIKVPDSLYKAADFFEARAFLTKDLSGYGVEFGAATNATPVPISCKVDYADFFDTDDGCNVGYSNEKRDYVPLKYKTSFEDMQGIEDSSLDFVIVCHVIEHVTETIRAIQKAYEKLRRGGCFSWLCLIWNIVSIATAN